MSRLFTALTLAVALLMTTFSGAAVATAQSGATVTLIGRLEQVSEPSGAHYEVDGYVVLHSDVTLLAGFVGQDVIVTGTLYEGVSIYMRKTIELQSITLKDDGLVTIPVLPPDEVTIPVLPPDEITIPVLPPDSGEVTVPVIRPIPRIRLPYFRLPVWWSRSSLSHLWSVYVQD